MMAAIEETEKLYSTAVDSLIRELESMSELIKNSFDILIDILAKRKQQHLTQLNSIKTQMESYLNAKQNNDIPSPSFLKDLDITEVRWRCDPNYQNLLSKLGQIDVLLNDKVLPYHNFPGDTPIKRKAVQKSLSVNKVESTSPYYPSVAYFLDNWYILDITNCKIYVFDKQANFISKEIEVKIRGECVKSRCLSISEKYIFTWNKDNKSLLTFTHEGYLMPQIHLPVEVEYLSSMSAGLDDYLAIADKSQDLVYLLQPYLNEKHRAIGYAINNPANLVRPKDVFLAKDNFIFVLDCGNPSIHKFNIKGHWISSFGSNQLDQELHSPSNLLITKEGFVIVACSYGFIRIYDPNTTTGYRISMSREKGLLWFPTRLAYSDDASFAVCDYENHRVQFFNIHNIAKNYFFD